MVPRDFTSDDADRDAVILSIEEVAARLIEQVADLQRFVALLRPPDPLNPLNLFPVIAHGMNGKDKSG